MYFVFGHIVVLHLINEKNPITVIFVIFNKQLTIDY